MSAVGKEHFLSTSEATPLLCRVLAHQAVVGQTDLFSVQPSSVIPPSALADLISPAAFTHSESTGRSGVAQSFGIGGGR